MGCGCCRGGVKGGELTGVRGCGVGGALGEAVRGGVLTGVRVCVGCYRHCAEVRMLWRGAAGTWGRWGCGGVGLDTGGG